MRLRSIIPLLLLPLPAPADPPDPVVSGYYTVGWETQSFRPCGGAPDGGPWWVSNPGPVLSVFQDLAGGPWGTIFVTVRVDLTERGRWGHLGGYTRSMAVTEVLDARAARRERDDCSRAREAE